MDKLVRKLTDKVTGQPIVNAIVKARPVGTPDGSGDVNMPETPSGSGIYATTDQIGHDTYKIIVNESDSLDEYTVEAGRAKVRSGVGAFLYPLIDRIIDAKLYLSGMIGDSSASASSGDFRTAILAATTSSTLKRELVLTQDAALDADAVVAQDLLIDLNGFSLTLNADITSVSNRITVRNGKLIVTGIGPKILSNVWTSFINVEFYGPHVEIQSSLISYVGCTGRATLPGAEDAGSIPVVAGGNHSFATASDLKLTTISTKTGSGRLTALQDWIDTWLSSPSRMGVLETLYQMYTEIAQWIGSSSAMRVAFNAGDIVIDTLHSAKLLGTDAAGKIIEVTGAVFASLTFSKSERTVGSISNGYVVTHTSDVFIVANASSAITFILYSPAVGDKVIELTFIPESTTNGFNITADFDIASTSPSTKSFASYSNEYGSSVMLATKLIWSPQNNCWCILNNRGL